MAGPSFIDTAGQFIDLYATLEITEQKCAELNNGFSPLDVIQAISTVPEKTIKSQFRSLALKYHPDKRAGFEEEFRKVSFAYEVLSQEATRGLYNQIYISIKTKQKNDDLNNKAYNDYVDSRTKKQKLMREELERREKGSFANQPTSGIDVNAIKRMERQINETRSRNRNYMKKVQEELLQDIPSKSGNEPNFGMAASTINNNGYGINSGDGDNLLYLSREPNSEFDFKSVISVLIKNNLDIVSNCRGINSVYNSNNHGGDQDTIDKENNTLVIKFNQWSKLELIMDQLITDFSVELVIKSRREVKTPVQNDNQGILLSEIHDRYMEPNHATLFEDPFYNDFKNIEFYTFTRLLNSRRNL